MRDAPWMRPAFLFFVTALYIVSRRVLIAYIAVCLGETTAVLSTGSGSDQEDNRVHIK